MKWAPFTKPWVERPISRSLGIVINFEKKILLVSGPGYSTRHSKSLPEMRTLSSANNRSVDLQMDFEARFQMASPIAEILSPNHQIVATSEPVKQHLLALSCPQGLETIHFTLFFFLDDSYLISDVKTVGNG